MFIFFGCLPKEQPVPARERINKSVQIDAGRTKNKVAFFSFDKDEIIAEVSPTIWDIFGDTSGVYINGFKSMKVAQLNKSWEATTDTQGLKFDYLTTISKDSMWKLAPNTAYCLHLGINDDYEELGVLKFMFTLANGRVEISFATLNGPIEKVQLPENKFHYSLINKKSVALPGWNDFDIAFGKYTQYVLFENEWAFYVIYGAVAGNISTGSILALFETVENTEILQSNLTQNSRLNIGWDWKKYTLISDSYTIDTDKTYLIKSNNGFFYKMRFVDFYNDFGVSGHPTFEFKLL